MKLSEFKTYLSTIPTVNILMNDGTPIPKHFHITEIGIINKHFIDCGGTERTENKISLQLWVANDVEHRLNPQKVLDIIQLSEKILAKADFEIEVQYQTTTISLFDLGFDGTNFILLPKQTDCLAKDKCGIPEEQLNTTETCCTPNSGCC